MALQGAVLIFRDARALAHWLGGAVPRTPGLLARPCVAFGIVPEAGGTPTLGILVEGVPPGTLPRPPEGSQGARLDLEAKKLRVLGQKGGLLRRTPVAETYAIQGAERRANIVQAVPLEPW